MSEHIPTSTIYGLRNGTIAWNDDFQASRDDKGLWQASESFTCHINETTTLLPEKGAACDFPGFSFLGVNSISVTNIQGDLMQVNVSYKGVEPNDEDDGDDEDPGYGDYTEELSITTSEEPIESNPIYARTESGITADEWITIRNFKSGKFEPVKDKPYTFKDINGHAEGKLFVVSSEKGKELLDIIGTGVESYLASYQTWRVTYTDIVMVPARWLNSVGFITSAINAPAVEDNRDWLFMGCFVSKSGDVYTITLEWRLSGLGGWDQRFYNKANYA